MSDKKIKFLGITVYKRKTKGNTTITRFLNVPVWKKVKGLNKNKYYLFGVRFFLQKKHWNNQKMDVCYICDSGYVTPTLVSVMSLILNKNFQTNLNIHIIGVNISAYAVACFEKFNQFKNVKMDIMNVKNPYDNIQTFHQHVSKAALLKFKIPNIFTKLHRILYIDGDTIIRHDLSELNDIDLKGYYVAATPDMLGNIVYNHHKKFNLEKYFNSGVMLFNLDLCRKDGVEEQLIYNKKMDIYRDFMDQDAFNQTFAGHVKWLSPKYNVMMLNDNNVPLPFSEKAKFFGLQDSELYQAYYDASIVHLTNTLKPWKNIEASDFYLWEAYYFKWQNFLAHKGLFYKKIYPDNTYQYRIFGIKLFRKSLKNKMVDSDNLNDNNDQKSTTLHICFTEGGGMGDCLLALPFIEHVYKCCPSKIKIDFYCKNPTYFTNMYYLNNVEILPENINSLTDRYDAVFQIIRYARLISGNLDKIKTMYPMLYKYTKMDNEIRKLGQIRDNLRLFNEYSITLGKKRPDHIDLFNIFNYKSKDARINISINETKTLSKFNLSSKRYITISRGTDGTFNSNHPKLWPLQFYNDLVKKIKHKYPMFEIIQIGANDRYGIISNTNKNLLGKTNFEELAVILKNAIIHIGEEGGLVHLNHLVNGKSLVLFGPTSKDVYGYSENINICGTCPIGNCYNIIPSWTDKCMLNIQSACMKSITPETVFEKLDNFFISHLNTWYQIVDHVSEEQLNYISDVEPMHLPELPKDKIFIFDIDKALKLFPQIKRFGLVFFMGIGDYFYATNFIEKLKIKYPRIHFDAFVSKNFDGNNSPLVADCLKTNPYIENVYLFDGYKNYNNWRSYKYNDVYDMVDEKTLVLPIIYFHTDKTHSRLEGLCKVFGIEIPKINLPPKLYGYRPNHIVFEALNKIKTTKKKIVFIQTTTRSSGFHYKYTNTLIRMLLELDYFVITPENENIPSDSLYVIDTKKFKITDSIALLKQIKEYGKEIYVFNMISCFTAISCALDIPCLCVQFFYDATISTVYFSNIYLVTHKEYKQIPADRQFIMPEDTYTMENKNAVYEPDILVNIFRDFLDITKKGK